eukprot:gene6782-10946_t
MFIEKSKNLVFTITKFYELLYFDEMSKKDYNENGFYSLCTNFIYGNCITNCIYFYEKLRRKHKPNFFVGYFYKKNDSPEFHVFLAFKTECGYYVYDPSREFDLFLPENVPLSANNNTFLLQNDVISITAGSSYGTYFLISEKKAKTVFFDEFKKDWKKDQIIWEFSLDEFIKPKPPKKSEKKTKRKKSSFMRHFQIALDSYIPKDSLVLNCIKNMLGKKK